MNQRITFSSLMVAGIAALAAVQPAQADSTQVVNVRTNQSSAGLEVVLETQGDDRPEVFVVSRNNNWVADVINTRLNVPKGGFQQDNPAPGISSVQVMPLDGNSVRVTVTGNGTSAPRGAVASRSATGLVFKVQATAEPTTVQVSAPVAASARPNPTFQPFATQPSATQPSATPPIAVQPSAMSVPTVQVPTPTATPTQTMRPGTTTIAQAQPADTTTTPTRQGNPATISPNTTPPTLPRAVPPPLGDITISNLDPSPGIIDLGSKERIPRLVLRNAPAREVLSLLARAAGVNIAYVDATVSGSGQTTPAASPAAQSGAGETDSGPRVTLDIENESVQDVFNHVLRLTGLQANKIGTTIYVGPQLPVGARNLISRTIRLNQVDAGTAASYLSTLGAETAVNIPPQAEIVTTRVPGSAGSPDIVQTITRQSAPRIEGVVYEAKLASPVLRGLQASPDSRLNAVVLVGSPQQVALATEYLKQLDLRRRQVTINVKIVDVNLSNVARVGSSFSFGINNSFFINDGGAASVNFGSLTPAPNVNSVTSPPTITNPISGDTFLNVDPNDPGVVIDNTNPGQRVIVDGFVVQDIPNGPLRFFRRVPSLSTNPLDVGITDITTATPEIVTITTDPQTGRPIATTTPGTRGTATASLPSLLQYPTNFLARLQAQVISGNAKILTDPNLTVQEGQTANINLTQEVFAGIQETVVQPTSVGGVPIVTRNIIKSPVGLTLSVQVQRVDDNGFVTLSVAPRVASIAGTFESGGQTAVLTSQRELSSGSIRLRDGQTLILAGVIQEDDRQQVSKIPILGDLPIIGALFRSTTGTNTRTEVIIVVTPQILDDGFVNSNVNYGYTPGRDAQQILQQNGYR